MFRLWAGRGVPPPPPKNQEDKWEMPCISSTNPKYCSFLGKMLYLKIGFYCTCIIKALSRLVPNCYRDFPQKLQNNLLFSLCVVYYATAPGGPFPRITIILPRRVVRNRILGTGVCSWHNENSILFHMLRIPFYQSAIVSLSQYPYNRGATPTPGARISRGK